MERENIWEGREGHGMGKGKGKEEVEGKGGEGLQPPTLIPGAATGPAIRQPLHVTMLTATRRSRFTERYSDSTMAGYAQFPAAEQRYPGLSVLYWELLIESHSFFCKKKFYFMRCYVATHAETTF